MSLEHQTYVLSAYDAYMGHFKAESEQEELYLSLAFFRFVNSGKYVLGMSFDKIMRYSEHKSAVVGLAARFLAENDQLADYTAGELLALFVCDVPETFSQSLEADFKESLQKLQPQQKHVAALFCKHLFAHLFLYPEGKLLADWTAALAGMQSYGPFSGKLEMQEFVADRAL